MNRLKDTYKHMAAVASALLLALSVLPACSDDEGGGADVPEGQYAKLVISLGSLDNAMQTKVEEKSPVTDQENDESYERYIASWWLVVTRPSDADENTFVIDRVITNKNYHSLEDVTVAGPTGLDSEMSIGLNLRIDQTYRFYALANLEYLANWEQDVKPVVDGWTEGAAFSPERLYAEMKPMTDYKGTTYIPMTSYGYEKKIESGTNQLSERIALIRLLGKVTLKVTNLTDEDITLNSLSMGNFRSEGDIFLFPYDINSDTKNLLATNMSNTYNPSFPNNERDSHTSTPFVSTDTRILVGEANAKEFTAFVNETKDISEEGKIFELSITSRMQYRGERTSKSGFSFVRRNDWLQIPVQISDVDATIAFDQQHMPIGGVPTTYKMQSGAIVPVVDFETNHAGIITITYDVTNVSSMTNPTLRHPGTYPAGTAVTTAVLAEGGNAGNLLIDVPTDNSFTLKPGADNKTGSFTVNLQELQKEAKASIILTLVIVDAKGREMSIPYTINISNKETTTDGGN